MAFLAQRSPIKRPLFVPAFFGRLTGHTASIEPLTNTVVLLITYFLKTTFCSWPKPSWGQEKSKNMLRITFCGSIFERSYSNRSPPAHHHRHNTNFVQRLKQTFLSASVWIVVGNVGVRWVRRLLRTYASARAYVCVCVSWRTWDRPWSKLFTSDIFVWIIRMMVLF